MAAKSTESHGHKYALLAEELYKNLKRSNATAAQLQSPEFNKVRNLDEKIESILSNPNLPDSMKARMYSEAAAEYFDLRQRAPEISSSGTSIREHPAQVVQKHPAIVQPPQATPGGPLGQYVTPTQEPSTKPPPSLLLDEPEVHPERALFFIQ